jgi:hypothetical protein
VVPSEALAGLAGAALFMAPGAGLAEMLPGARALPPARRLAYAWLLGIAWTAGVLYALSHFLGVPLRRPALLAVAALPALAGLISGLLRRKGTKERPRRRRRTDLLTKITVLVSVFVSLGILAGALTHPQMEWDGRMTWSAQARYIRAEGTVDASVLTQPGWYVTNPWYPLLLPVAQAAVLELGQAGDDEPLYLALYAFFFPVWLLVLYDGARRWAGRKAAALTCLAAALLPAPAFHRGGGAAGAFSDLPLACFYGAGLLLLLKPRPRPSDGIAAGLLLGAAVLTKAEGSALALAAMAALAAITSITIAGPSRRRFKALLPAAVPVALAFGLLFSWQAGIPANFESYQEMASWDRFWPDVVTRAPLLLGKIRDDMIALQSWGIFWSVWPLVLLAGWRGLRRRVTPALVLAALAPLGIAWIAYAISLHPAYIVRATWNRFLIQASIPLLLLFALALRDLLRRARFLRGGLSRSPRPRPDTPAGSPGTAA